MRSRDELRRITLKEREQMQYDVGFEMQQLFVRSLRHDLVLAEGEFELKIDVENHIQIIDVRFSYILEHRLGQWLIIHSHYSTPDAMLEEGASLMDALQARNAELEREVALRTAALNQSLETLKATQAQLVHHEKMASLGALTAGIAHEIKNPLNFVTNFASLSAELTEELEKALLNGENVHELLADLKHNALAINTHGQRADAIVRNMMQHASSKTGTHAFVDLHTIIDEHIPLALHAKKTQASEFSCVIDRNYALDFPPLQAHPGELGRVFLNILSNAFDAVHGQENASVRVSTRFSTHAVHIQFSDNGPGVSPGIATKIFEPFFTTKPAGTGTGLGLSLSYDIITQGHGGTLALAQSELGGATFLITLPLKN